MRKLLNAGTISILALTTASCAGQSKYAIRCNLNYTVSSSSNLGTDPAPKKGKQVTTYIIDRDMRDLWVFHSDSKERASYKGKVTLTKHGFNFGDSGETTYSTNRNKTIAYEDGFIKQETKDTSMLGTFTSLSTGECKEINVPELPYRKLKIQ